MNTLFPMQPVYPPGFKYFPEFLSKEEEEHLLGIISGFDLHTFKFQGHEAKRKVASFGYDWNFETRSLSEGVIIPTDFAPFNGKVASFIGVPPSEIGELLITEYPAGWVINWHRDAPPFDIIAGISLLSDCKFRFSALRKISTNPFFNYFYSGTAPFYLPHFRRSTNRLGT